MCENHKEDFNLKCEKCEKIPFLKLKFSQDKIIKIEEKCSNNHTNIISLKEFLINLKNSISKKKCYNCFSFQTANNKIFYCNICKIYICNNCSIKHLNTISNHIIIPIDNLNITCDICFHLGKNICLDCLKNLCDSCYEKHKNLKHNVKTINELKISEEKFKEINNNCKKAKKYLKYIKFLKSDFSIENNNNMEIQNSYDSFIEKNNLELELIVNLLEYYQKENLKNKLNCILCINLINIINFNNFNKSLNEFLFVIEKKNNELKDFFQNNNNYILVVEEEENGNKIISYNKDLIKNLPIIKCHYKKGDSKHLKFFLDLRNEALLSYEKKMNFEIKPFPNSFSLTVVINNFKKIEILNFFDESEKIKGKILNQLYDIYDNYYSKKI